MKTIATAKASSIIDNLINGNLTDALEASCGFPAKHLIDEAMGRGYNYNEALLMSCYLKKVISFQDYCDSLNNTKA
jgi:hypothetical protein